MREDNPYLNKTYVYTYDNAGNRLSKKTYAYTTGTPGNETATESYNYTGDRLTQVGSTVYQYGAIGNPDTYNGYSLTWNGRQLMEMSMNAGQFRYSFTYNDEGIRTSKTYGSTTHYYTLNGSQIVTETWVTKTQDGEEIVEHPNHFLVYLYDESGAPIGLQYRNKTYEKYDFDTYYFEKNLQGDIIAIYTEAGTKIGSYTYDAWGNCTCSYATGATPTQKKIVQMFNPFRYRGYYYDYDTGLYYLQSRYYVPQWGRFLNADSCLYNRVLGFNLFLYCDNNPVNYLDPYGEDAEALLAGWASAGWGLAAVDGPLPIGDIIYVAGCFVLGGVVIIEAMTNIDEIADTTLPTYDLPMVDALPGNVTATDAATIGISIGATVEKEKYDPNPYKRPGQKKQGRENRNGSRKKPGWEPRNNKRSKTPAEPKKHTPGKDHRKYFKSIGYEKIEIYEVK